jgi:hypothetical protein
MEFLELAVVELFGRAAQEGAVVVKLMPPPGELERLRDVLIGSLGLSGTIALTGVLVGALVGGAIFLLRYRRSA